MRVCEREKKEEKKLGTEEKWNREERQIDTRTGR